MSYDKRTLASGTIFYNDVKSLERTLRSLHDKVDYMYCVDGRFKWFDDDDTIGLSIDGSRDLVKSFDNAILVDVPDSYEIQKREAYLDLCEKYKKDYLIIADSDEYVLEYDEDLFRKSLINTCESTYFSQYNIFSIMLEINQPNYNHIVQSITGSPNPVIVRGAERQFAHHPRLWHRPYEVQYRGTHYNFINKDPKTGSLHNCETMASVAIVPGIKLGHDHLLRTKEFLDNRLKYQTCLVNFEQKKLRKYIYNNKKVPDVELYDMIDDIDDDDPTTPTTITD